MPGIDILIPNYNYGRYLKQCVESVLAQGVPSLRVLIIDNASTDNSVETAQELAKRDPRIELVVHRVNLGPQASFNEGISWASSEYFTILCADDLLMPGALARAIAIMERHPGLAFVHGQEITFIGDHAPLGASRPTSPASREGWSTVSGKQFIEWQCAHPARFINAGTMVVRTGVQKKAGFYRASLPFTDDLEMALRLALLGGVGETSAFQGARRLHGANMSIQHADAKLSELKHRQAAFESFFASEGRALPSLAACRENVRSGIAARAYWWGAGRLLHGQVAEAAGLFAYACSQKPSFALLPPVRFLLEEKRPLAAAAAKTRKLWKTAGPEQAQEGAPSRGSFK